MVVEEEEEEDEGASGKENQTPSSTLSRKEGRDLQRVFHSSFNWNPLFSWASIGKGENAR